MISSIALTLASRFAPGIVRRLAGDGAGDIAERLLGIARTVTGAESPEQAVERLMANDEMRHEFELQAASLDVELEQAYLADRQNARSRELEMARLGKGDLMMDIIGVVTVLGFIATVLAAFFVPDMTSSQQNLIFALAGILGAGFTGIIGYYYGSSRGSAMKNDLLRSQAPPAPARRERQDDGDARSRQPA